MEQTLDIKITFQSSVIKGSDARTVEGHPLRNWKIQLVAVENKKDRKGRLSELLDHVEYILHPTFENPRRVVTKEPYILQEKGWGEFDMRIVLNFANNVATEVLLFDLSFRQPLYSVTRTVVFQNPSQELLALLRSSHGVKKRRASSLEKPSTAGKKIRSPATTFAAAATAAATARPREMESGTSLSPSTPMFPQQQNAGYSSAYSVSPQSFASPSAGGATSGMLTSPYDYTRSIKTPQAEYEAASNHHHHQHHNHHYMSDLSDNDERPATVPGHHGGGNGAGGGGGGGGGGRSESSGGSSYGNAYDNRNHRRPQQNGHGKHNGSSSSSDNSNPGEDDEIKHEENGQETHIIDDVYTESDLDHVNPIHGSDLNPDMRRAWGIPDNVNMLELARRLSSMNSARLAEIQELVEKYRTEEMTVEEKEDEVMMDLYSLGPELLTRLWEYCQS